MNNYHLILVHFPIALLTLYSVLEIISFKKLRELPYWFYIKAILVIIGSLASLVTRQTGEMISGAYTTVLVHKIIEMHELFANISVGIFLTVGVLYAIQWIRNHGEWEWLKHKNISWFWNILVRLQTLLYRRPILVLLAFVGVATISMTGALGGSISHGPESDPVVKLIYDMLIK